MFNFLRIWVCQWYKQVGVRTGNHSGGCWETVTYDGVISSGTGEKERGNPLCWRWEPSWFGSRRGDDNSLQWKVQVTVCVSVLLCVLFFIMSNAESQYSIQRPNGAYEHFTWPAYQYHIVFNRGAYLVCSKEIVSAVLGEPSSKKLSLNFPKELLFQNTSMIPPVSLQWT